MATRGTSEDVRIDEDIRFSDLTISQRTVEALNRAGFDRPSPIQLQALPLSLLGVDLLIQAKSGTGKTLVFAITALEFLQSEEENIENQQNLRTQVLILAPTREIAQQIVFVIKSIKSDDCFVHAFIGGLPLKEDQTHLKRCHIAVGTPGRIEELLRLKHLRADSIRLMVLDEADALLCKEFQVNLRK